MANDASRAEEHGLQVLVVDDSPVMRAFIRRVLALSGLPTREVLEAGDGESALEILGGRHVDLVLSDVNMPRMNGSELMRRMSEASALRAIPVIVISTDSSRLRVESMLSLGARGYVQKPFQPESLRAEIERVLGI